MSLILLMTALSGHGGTTQDTGTVLTRFLAPDVHAKPMARMWFPDAANKELSFSVTPITPDNLERGTVKLELPLQRTDAPASTFGPTAYDHFLFTDQFVSAVVVRIADVVEKPGANSPFYVFDFKSLTPITDRVSVFLGADLPRVIFIKPFIVTMSDEHW